MVKLRGDDEIHPVKEELLLRSKYEKDTTLDDYSNCLLSDVTPSEYSRDTCLLAFCVLWFELWRKDVSTPAYLPSLKNIMKDILLDDIEIKLWLDWNIVGSHDGYSLFSVLSSVLWRVWCVYRITVLLKLELVASQITSGYANSQYEQSGMYQLCMFWENLC